MISGKAYTMRIIIHLGGGGITFTWLPNIVREHGALYSKVVDRKDLDSQIKELINLKEKYVNICCKNRNGIKEIDRNLDDDNFKKMPREMINSLVGLADKGKMLFERILPDDLEKEEFVNILCEHNNIHIAQQIVFDSPSMVSLFYI